MESGHLQTTILLNKVELLSKLFLLLFTPANSLKFYYDHFEIKCLNQNQVFFNI